MKTSVLCTLIAVAAMGVGIGVGWLLRGEGAAPESPPSSRILTAMAAAPAAAGGKLAPVDDREHSAAVVATELEKMKTMSVKEFAVRMTDAWVDFEDADNFL